MQAASAERAVQKQWPSRPEQTSQQKPAQLVRQYNIPESWEGCMIQVELFQVGVKGVRAWWETGVQVSRWCNQLGSICQAPEAVPPRRGRC